MLSNNKKAITFQHQNGNIDGIYQDAGVSSLLVIIINGHNGFYNYGMFPYLQQMLFQNRISSYSFNFSHGGIIGDDDYFKDLEKYEKNCMRLETEDVLCVLQNLKCDELSKHEKVFLLAHSLGGVPAIFSAKKTNGQNIVVNGIILVSTVKTLNFWPSEMIKEWATAGVFYKKNNRTKQELPQGFEFLQEVLKSDTDWNIEKAITSIPQVPILIIHGEKDEAIPLEHGYSLFSWIKEINPNADFEVIQNATHTYNTKHPFEQASNELNAMIVTVITWLKKFNN